jgi:hypothetical protein
MNNVSLRIEVHSGKLDEWSIGTYTHLAHTNIVHIPQKNEYVPLSLYSRVIPISYVKNCFTTFTDCADTVYPESNGDIQIIVKRADGDLDLSKALSSHFRRNLLRFLKKGREIETQYCCVDFMHEMLGKPHFGTNFINLLEWEMVDFAGREDLFSPEDVVLFTDAYGKMVHFACYLGSGFYISLNGSNGPLVITDLEMTKAAYTNCSRTFLCKPKSLTSKLNRFVLEDRSFYFDAFVQSEKTARHTFAMLTTNQVLKSKETTYSFFNIHFVALKKLADMIASSQKNKKLSKIQAVDMIGDSSSYEAKGAGSVQKLVLTNTLYRRGRLQCDWMRQIHSCMLADAQNQAIPINTTWRFNFAYDDDQSIRSTLALLRRKGFVAGIERPYGHIGKDKTAAVVQYIWVQLQINVFDRQETQEKFSANNLLIERLNATECRPFQIYEMTVGQKCAEIIQDLAYISNLSSAIRQWRFNVIELPFHSQKMLVQFLQSLGYTTSLEPFTYRIQDGLKTVSKQDIVITL